MTVDARKLLASTSSPSTVYGHIDTLTSNRHGHYWVSHGVTTGFRGVLRTSAAAFDVTEVEPYNWAQFGLLTSSIIDPAEPVTSKASYGQTILHAIYSHLSQAIHASVTYGELRELVRSLEEESPARPEPDPQRVAHEWLEGLRSITSHEPTTSLATWYAAVTGDEEE
jgi:hypothetical protein